MIIPRPKRAAGGYARAQSLTPERRREIAKAASLARWSKPPKPKPPRRKPAISPSTMKADLVWIVKTMMELIQRVERLERYHDGF